MWKEFPKKLAAGRGLEGGGCTGLGRVFEEEEVRREWQGAQTGTSIGNNLDLCGRGLGAVGPRGQALLVRGGLVGQYSERIRIRLRSSV